MKQRCIIVRANLKTNDVSVFTGYKDDYDDQWFYLYNAKRKETIPEALPLRLLINAQAEDMTHGEAVLALASFELEKDKWSYDILPLQSNPF